MWGAGGCLTGPHKCPETALGQNETALKPPPSLSRQAAQYPSGPATVRHDGELPEHRPGEGALQGQICSAQQPAGLPGCAARLDSRGSVCAGLKLWGRKSVDARFFVGTDCEIPQPDLFSFRFKTQFRVDVGVRDTVVSQM